MSNFKNIEKLGLLVWDQDCNTGWVKAEELEQILQSAHVVYGVWDKNGCRFAETQFPGHTHSAILLAISPIKKKTKAEAALEFVDKVEKGLFRGWTDASVMNEAKRILEMKD